MIRGRERGLAGTERDRHRLAALRLAPPPPRMKEPIPGLYLALEDASSLAPWSESGAGIKRRHFVIEGQTLKLFGRRGKTYKGHLNLLAVTALKPASDASAPHGALEIHVRASRTRQQTCILAPDHSAEELFMELGNAVPSHVISADLWRRYMGSRPAITTDAAPREYRVGKTLGTGTFGKVGSDSPPALKLCTRHTSLAPPPVEPRAHSDA